MKQPHIESLLILALTGSALADPSTYDKIWNTAKLINNSEAKVIQSLNLSGRLQGDAYSFRSEETSHENIEWRRFRFGFKAQVFNHFTLHSEMDLDMNEVDSGSWNEFYNRLTDTYIAWTPPSKDWKIKIGKQSAGFTLDGATSSKKLLVPERSVVAENIWFPTEYFTGASASGKAGNGSFKVGGFSASGESEFGHFESGYFTLLSAGWEFNENGTLRLDYVFNNPDHQSDYAVGTWDLKHIASLVYQQMLSEKLGLWADLSGAKGINQSNLVGVDFMPFYNFTDRLQLVLQYANVISLEGEPDVRLARYAYKNSSATKAESVHNLLLGFNVYLYGHKLKWQNAIEYNRGTNLAGTGNDYNGYGITSALRISW